eukprot:10131863-Prorocentrum_lima.AAC.1
MESQGSTNRSTLCASLAESFRSNSGPHCVVDTINQSSQPSGTVFQVGAADTVSQSLQPSGTVLQA